MNIQYHSDNTSDNTFILPLKTTLSGYGLTVNWGDGASNTFVDGTELKQDNMTHTYASAGEYTIAIISTQLDHTQQQMPAFSFDKNYIEVNKNPKKLISLDSPLLNMGIKLSSCFIRCSNLTEIPGDLFAKNTKATTFSRTFSFCWRLPEVPAGLFANNPDAYVFSSCFANCSSLKLNPNIFCNEETEKATRFAGKNLAFNGCFENCGKNRTIGEGGTAPALWNYEMGAPLAIASCFTGVTRSIGLQIRWNGCIKMT